MTSTASAGGLLARDDVWLPAAYYDQLSPRSARKGRHPDLSVEPENGPMTLSSDFGVTFFASALPTSESLPCRRREGQEGQRHSILISRNP